MRLSFPKSNKIYVTSDIHGGLELLKELVSLVDNNSYLFILGDLFEKGNRSLDTLKYVMKLSKKKNVFVIRGNNDQALIKALNPNNIRSFNSRINNPKSIINQMIAKIHAQGTPLELQKAVNEHFQEEISFLNSLDNYIEVDDFLFVHAGISPQGLEKTSLETMIGLDNFYQLGHNEKRMVVCGHYPTAMYYQNRYDNSILIDEEKRIICLDGGYGATNLGQLNMLKITKAGEKYLYDTYATDYYPKATVIKDCQKVGNKRGICFPNYEIKIIELGECFSMCLVVKTNEIFSVKNELIAFKNEQAFVIDDCPHNHLGLKKGDEVKVIWNKYMGYVLVSHHGECGWVSRDCLEMGEKNA